MPLHTNTPGQKNLVFVHPKNGKFMVETDNGPEEYQAIEGTLDLVRIEFDPGNASNKIQPYDAFVMHITDEDKIYRIKMNVDRNFSFSVARVLGDLNKGDEIIAKTKAGDDPTVTFCNILKKDSEGKWVRPEQTDLPTDKAEKIKFLKNLVETHSAFVPKRDASLAE